MSACHPRGSCRMVDVGRDLQRSSGPIPLLKQGHLEPVAQECDQMASEHLQGWRPHNLLGQPVPALSQPYSEKVFPHVQREPPVFQFVPIASGPVTAYHWKEPGSIFFATSLQVFLYIDKILPSSLLFSRLNSPDSLRFSS